MSEKKNDMQSLLQCPGEAETRAYYEEVLRRGGRELSDAVEVRVERRDHENTENLADANHVSPSCTDVRWPLYKSLHAKRSFKEGEVIFTEEPLVSMQHVHNGIPCCAVCLRFVDEDDPLCCNLGNLSTRFCANCRSGKDASVHMMYMCTGCSSGDGTSGATKDFLAMAEETNDVFILAARLLMRVMYDAKASTIEDAWRPYAMGYKNVWWKSVARPEDVPEDEEEAFRADLKELASDAFHLFCKALEERNPTDFERYRGTLLTLDVWGSVIGMFELNHLSILARGPSSSAAEKGDDDDDDVDDDDVDDDLVEGSGFYALQSCMNHSCDPNCRVMIPRSDNENAKAILQSVREISEGEELLVSYIDESEEDPISLAERAAQLKDYGFECHCSRCQMEREFCV